MAGMSKPRDEHDPYYDPYEPETGILPSLSEALIIAIAAVIALFALYQIHESLDRVGQSITSSASMRGVPQSVTVSQSFRLDSQDEHAAQPGEAGTHR